MRRLSGAPLLTLALSTGLAPARPAAAACTPAPSRTVDTVAQLRTVSGLRDDEVVEARAYRQAGDLGGGCFQFDARSADGPDDATVVWPEGAPSGRLRRMVAPGAPVLAEWFGARRAPGFDNSEAINRALAVYRRVDLQEGTYEVGGGRSHGIDLARDYRIQGQGPARTTVRLLDGWNPPGNISNAGGVWAGESYYSVFQNRARRSESADNVVIRDLTIDCNFDGQDKRSTLGAIIVEGGNPLIENVHLRGFGVGFNPLLNHADGSPSPEDFVVMQGLVYGDRESSRTGGTFRRLHFTGPGSPPSFAGALRPPAEITLLVLGGADRFAQGGEAAGNWWPTYG
ncbi:MAG: hypothetical protein HY554_19545, partial [Elusimicrobia bacterium]|nr:hypothetical protein [Elusimicrobiota bacterium]